MKIIKIGIQKLKLFAFLRVKGTDTCTFLVSYPRSGNTWMRNLIAHIKHPDEDLSYNDILKIVPDIYKTADLRQCETPCIIKSHETYRNEYRRVIYLYRDGRDVAVSYYNYYKKHKNYNKPFEDFVREMLSGSVDFGSWQGHIKSWMFEGHNIPFLPISYENLCCNTSEVLKDIAAFLNISVNESIIENAIKRSTVSKQMKNYLNVFPEFRWDGYRDDLEFASGPGKWTGYFDESLLDYFWENTGEVMARLGYKK